MNATHKSRVNIRESRYVGVMVCRYGVRRICFEANIVAGLVQTIVGR